jgi:exodeoxyribonuclease V alpha subunit
MEEVALFRRLVDFVPELDAEGWARRIVAAPYCPTLIGASPSDHKPVIVQAIGTRRFLYFQKYLRAELDFQRDLTQRLASQGRPTDDRWPAILRDVLGSQPLRLDDDQRLALGVALANDFAIISGGPGTGKTSIVLTLLRCLICGGVAPERIALAAPTGRAAQRLTDALRAGLERLAPDDIDARLRVLAASTLHQLLAYRPSRNVFARHCENPVPADVVIVDEVSMVGVVLMSQLLQALAPTTKLILLGDKDQLPSVEAGAVLANLVRDEHVNGFTDDQAARLAAWFPDIKATKTPSTSPLQNRIVLLRTNHRSQQGIRAAAQAINRQDTSIAERLPAVSFADPVTTWQTLETDGGCWLLEQTQATAGELRGFLQHWAEQAYFQSRLDGSTLAEMIETTVLDSATQHEDPCRRLFALLDRFRLLTLVRDGAWGCEEINAFLDMHLRPRLGGSARGGLFAGAPVLITRNDNARGLFNGDVGMTLRDRSGGLHVLFQRQDSALSFPAESLPAHELGFALTVHKSQGSEYANVMVVLPPKAGKRLLTKELIYTAITRAKSLAILCSSKDVLRFAIGRKIMRESGVFAIGHQPDA